jgi:hypothetical protein
MVMAKFLQNIAIVHDVLTFYPVRKPLLAAEMMSTAFSAITGFKALRAFSLESRRLF